MSVDFTQIEAVLDQTKIEVTEHDASVVALDESKVALTAAQDVVAAAQTAVIAATEATTKEKADVIAGITDAISQLNAILAELQA